MKFGTPSVPTADLKLEAVPDTINITRGNEQRGIDLYLSNTSTQKYVAGQEIIAHIFDLNNGRLGSYSATTDLNGHVSFIYAAPATLPTSDLVITFEVAGGTPVLTEDVTMKFDNSTYNIIPDQNITVTNISTDYPVAVTLTKQASGGAVQPAVGKTVVAEFVMPVNGKLSAYEVIVDASGVATFIYTSPDRNLPAADANITFFYKDDNTVTGQTLVHFDPQAIDTVTNMYLAPESFTVTSPEEVQNITIVTVNAQNVGISAQVQLEQPNNGTDYGSFDTTNVTTDASGQAVVVYTAPTDISTLVERNITVDVLGTTITQELNIQFNTNGQSTKYEIVETIPNSLAVDSVDQIGVKIVEVGNPANVIADSNVEEVNLTSEFSNMLVFSNGTDNFTYTDIADNQNIGVETGTLSGSAIVKVSASIDDDSDVSTPNIIIEKDIAITIISGPVTVMSMPYVGSGTCVTTPTLQADKYIVHAVDKYSNPARGVQVTPTLINGIRGGLEPSAPGTGTLSGTTDPIFQDGVIGGANVLSTDRLIITINSQRSDPSYLGGWTIDQIAGNELHLNEDYTPPSPAVSLDTLSYAVGSEDRILGTERVVAHIVSPDGNYLTDGSGALNLEVCYDPKLVLHTLVLAAHVIDRGVHTGISTIQSLRWDQFTSSVGTVLNDGSINKVFVSLHSDGSIKEPLIGLDIDPSAFNVEIKPHCVIDIAQSSFHTNEGGQVEIAIVTDGNVSATGGVDTCTAEWNTELSSIHSEY